MRGEGLLELDMLETALTAFTTLFAVIGPIDSAVIAASLTPHATRAERRAISIKAVAIAQGYLAGSGVELVCVPTFADILIEGEHRTAIRLSVEDRARHSRNGGGAPLGQSADDPPT